MKIEYANSMTPGVVIKKPKFVIYPELYVYGLFTITNIDYILYKIYGPDWGTERAIVTILNNLTGEKYETTCVHVYKCFKSNEKNDFFYKMTAWMEELKTIRAKNKQLERN